MKKRFLLAIALLDLIILYGAVAVLRAPPIYPVPLVGNWDRTIQALPKPASSGRYAFLVLGDSRDGTGVFETLLAKAQSAQIPFGVHLGDFVPHAVEKQYAFFLGEMARRPRFPLFMVAGNHDVEEDRFHHFFEKTMGPRQVSFSYEKDLFILLDNAVRPTNDFLPWLEETLQKNAKGKRHIFLFMHRPAFDVDPSKDTFIINPSYPLHQTAKKWGIDYVVAGHYHSYLRSEADGVRYVVTGGAGSPLYGKRSFYHALYLEVDETRFVETLLTTGWRPAPREELIKGGYLAFYDFHRRFPWLFVSLLILSQTGLIFLMFRRYRKSYN